MSNIKLQTLKGFRDFLPQKMAIRNEVIKRLRGVFEKYGFEELQTPVLEYQEVLLGKYGQEAEKLMYLFEDQGGRKVGMKYDLTVPLARVAASYAELPIPFKRYQIQPVWRAENTQKGRYREFWQCDIDTVGKTSPIADAETLAVITEALKALDFKNFKIFINSRKVLFELMDRANIPEEKRLTVLQSLDKLDKVDWIPNVQDELIAKGISSKQIVELKEFVDNCNPLEYDPNLQIVINNLNQLGVSNKYYEFSPYLVRGLDYYTGTIFEAKVTEPKIGSIAGGGRYDNLIKSLGGPDLPSVGTTIGLDRVCDVIEELNLWPNLNKTSTKLLVTVFTPDLLENSIKIARDLRENGVNTELYPNENAKLDKQLKYADKKGIPYAVIIGPEEVKENKVVLKNLKTKEQIKTSIENLVSLVK